MDSLNLLDVFVVTCFALSCIALVLILAAIYIGSQNEDDPWWSQ